MSPILMNGKPALESYSTRRITITGIAHKNDGSTAPLEILRTRPGNPKVIYYNEIPNRVIEHTYVPPTPRSPFGDVHLYLELGDIISANERNFVYNVSVLNHQDLDFHVPPLVIKVATERAGQNLAEEAAVYRDLETLQGVVVPRCFGYFREVIDHREVTILPWDGPDCKYPRTKDDFDIFLMPNPAASLNILLLEKLGDRVPTGIGKVPESTKQDIFDMYADIAQFHIWYEDWGVHNMLMAPISPPGLAGLPSPRTGRIYTMRMIDFESAVVTNSPPDSQIRSAKYYLQDVVDQIAWAGREWPTGQNS